MPRVYAPDDDAPTALASLRGVVVGGGSVCGRESVAMMTPDETTATAIFARERRRGGRERMLLACAAGPVGGKVRYYLLERISLAHEDEADEHGHGQSCTTNHPSSAQHTSICDSSAGQPL